MKPKAGLERRRKDAARRAGARSVCAAHTLRRRWVFVAAVLAVLAVCWLGRPWWGFVILALADAFYGWLIQTGSYDYETLTGDLLRLTSDIIYMLAYLVIAFSFLRQYVLLKIGPREASPTMPRR